MFLSDIEFKAFLTVLKIFLFDVVIFNEHIPSPGHSFSQFPVRNYFSHPEQESQEDTERDIAHHILNGLIFNKKRRETSKATLLPSSGDGTEKKFHGETSLFNGCTYTQRDLQSRFGREKNSSKGLNFNKSEENHKMYSP